MSSMAEGYTIALCESSRLPELFALRARVWIDEGADPRAFADGAWSDDRDKQRVHWVVLLDGDIVGGASMSFHSSLAQLEEAEAYQAITAPSGGIIAAPARMVIDREHRGRGIADALLAIQDQAANEAGAVLSVRQASPAMKRLLCRHGWRDHGPAPRDPRFPGVVFSVMSRTYPGATR